MTKTFSKTKQCGIAKSWNVTDYRGIKDFESVACLDTVKNCFLMGVRWQRDIERSIQTLFLVGFLFKY